MPLDTRRLGANLIDRPTATKADAMATPVKKTRRTAERILDVTLELFNRFGEPNVSTTLISAELKISTGNLYYHYPAKDLLVDRLFDRYEAALNALLKAADDVHDVEDAWLFFHMLFELIWQYRFLYRDLNDLLSKNRRIETHFQYVLKEKTLAVQRVLAGLARGQAIRLTAPEAESVATAMVVVSTYWLSYEYVRDPRHALEPENAGAALLRGASHVLSLLAPYFEPAQKQHLLGLAQAYSRPASPSSPTPRGSTTPAATTRSRIAQQGS
jgi:AcrR family transcriptional regulator